MERLTKKQIEDYKQLCYDRDHGRILTPDGLRLVCEGLDRDPMKIGIHMLETLAKFQGERK